jgi:hypothetical protein
MSIFSKLITTIPGTAVSINHLKFDPTAKSSNDSTKGSASLTKFLKERQLIAVDETCEVDQARERVEKSGVVQLMNETCTLVNKLAGRTIVDVHSFLPPEPIICCFIFAEESAEYFMRLELQGTIPTLTFAERKWRDTVTNDFVRWAYRLADIEPVTITVKLVHEFRDIRVAPEQVREWFMYLVSSMDRSHTPSF